MQSAPMLAVAVLAALAPAHRVPADDAFTASITAATGAYRADAGAARIALSPKSGAGVTRATTATMTSGPCRRERCLPLNGELAGTITRRPAAIPDVGQTFALSLHGTLRGVGAVRAHGTVHGTGFIEHGRETLSLTITGRHGSVMLTGESGTVPGFTGP
jgi:hypothetical protein